jgi:hypothetical protein
LPLFRYEYLRDKTKELIAHIQGIESRMLPIQFSLDDFAEIVDAIRRPLAAQQAELEAVKQRISELTQNLAGLVQVEQALKPVVIALDQAAAECDCDWYCWLCTIATGAFLTVVTFLALFGVMAAGGGILASLLTMFALEAFNVWYTKFTYDSFTCANITPVWGGRPRCDR